MGTQQGVYKSSLKKRIVHAIKSKTVGEQIVYTVVFLLFFFFAFSYVYMLFWTFLSGLKSHNEFVMNPFGWVQNVHWENYGQVFEFIEIEGHDFFGLLKNSLIFSIIGPFFSGMFTAMIAYVTAKYKFPGANLLYPISVLVMTIPIYGSGGAAYKLHYNLGNINSYNILFYSWGGLGMGYLLYYTTFKSLSWEYAEAALLDGANEYQVFFLVMFPQIINMFGALYVTSWIGEWNNYSTSLIYYPKLPTIATGLYVFERDMQYYNRMDILFAGYFITAIPPIALFAVFSKSLMNNVSLGGIKE